MRLASPHLSISVDLSNRRHGASGSISIPWHPGTGSAPRPRTGEHLAPWHPGGWRRWCLRRLRAHSLTATFVTQRNNTTAHARRFSRLTRYAICDRTEKLNGVSALRGAGVCTLFICADLSACMRVCVRACVSVCIGICIMHGRR